MVDADAAGTAGTTAADITITVNRDDDIGAVSLASV